MYVSQKEIVVRSEQYRDLLREAERERLISAVKTPAGAGTGLLGKVVGWFGAPQVKAEPVSPPPSPAPAPGK